MKFGLSDSHYKEIIKIIAKYPEIQEVIIYGSRADGTHKESSDVDLAVKGQNLKDSIFDSLKNDFWTALYPISLI